MSDETIEKTFQVTDPARLTISNIRGSIVIQPGETNLIQVKAVKYGNFDSGRYSIEMTQDSDGSVRVETRSSESMLGFLSHPPRVEYTVHVPQGIHLSASGVSNSIKVSGLNGDFRLKTVSGGIDLTDLSGPLKLNVVSGDISGSRLSGTLGLESVSGRVRMMESAFPNADASTVSGELVLQTSLADGPYHFSSVSGSVRMLVPADTHCNAELNSVSGSIRSSLPATTTRLGHGSKISQIQGGGAEVRLKSVSGSLSFETEGIPAEPVSVTSPVPVPPTPPSMQVPPAPVLSTAEILQRIESGEMTVDEAVKLMKDQP
jgi:DUF4097 and DUF4098 domain-containing protein YvlB